MKNRNIYLEIIVKDFINKTNLIYKKFSLFIKEDFLLKNKYKAHNLYNHIDNFKEKIKINQQDENPRDFRKYDIHYVNYWINIWNEINWIRPSLIIKSNRYNKWYDILVIPMTWLFNENLNKKKLDTFDIIIKSDIINKLRKESLLKIRHLKSISKKRILNKIWRLNNDNYIYDKIDKNIKQMMWIK